jgi:hypothetical protein
MSLSLFVRDTHGLDISPRRCGAIMAQIGHHYQKLKPHKIVKPTLGRLYTRRTYVLQLAAALGIGCILVFGDESYANIGKTHSYGYAPDGAAFANWLKKGGKGARLCWSHFMSATGFLINREPISGAPWSPALGSQEPYPTAEMMFSATKGGNTDYHGNFDHTQFMIYVRNHLIPALKYKYPDASQKVRVIMDNAPYHVASVAVLEGGPQKIRFNPFSVRKPDLVNAMKTVGCKVLQVNHVQKDGTIIVVMTHMTDQEAQAKGGHGRATLPEIAEAATNWLVANRPRVLMNDVEAAFDAAFGDRIMILWGPPNYPEGNASEFAWQRAKAFAELRPEERTIAGLLVNIRRGLYTDEVALPGVFNDRGGNFMADPVTGLCPTAAALIDHVLYSPKGGVQLVIDRDERLSGSLKDLKYAPADWDRANKCLYRLVMRKNVKDDLKAEAVGDEEAAEYGSEDESDEENGA